MQKEWSGAMMSGFISLGGEALKMELINFPHILQRNVNVTFPAPTKLSALSPDIHTSSVSG